MPVSTTMFFGDGEHPFTLTGQMILELETKCGPVGAVCTRVFLRQFNLADIHETIRLSLIGAGMPPKRAAEMIERYAVDRPIAETHPIAARILERLWFGAPHDTEARNGQS